MNVRGKKKVLICGAGSIGVYVGVKLAGKNHDVTLFGRRKLKKINDSVIIDGEKFEIPEKKFRLEKNSKQDFIFITSKLYDLDNLIRLLKKNRIGGKIVVGIQNGLVDVSKYSKMLGKKIVPIVVFSGFNLKGNNLSVTPTPVGWVTEKNKEGKEVSNLLLESDIPCKPLKNFDSLRAEKTIVNCCLNGLSAIEKKPFSSLFKNPKTREFIENLFDESYNILARYYILGDAKEMKKRMIKHWENLDHYSSTYQDIASGRKNEIKFFNGYIIELGKKYNLPTNYNGEIVRKVNEITIK